MEETVSVRRALADVLCSRRLAVVLSVGSAMALASRLIPTAWYWLAPSLALSALFTGYAITYARQIATLGDGQLTGMESLGALARRGIVGTAATLLPVMLTLGLMSFAGSGFGLLWLDEVFVTGVPDVLGWLALALSVIGLAALLLSPAIPTIVGARYAFHDKTAEAFRYGGAFRRAWRFRRAALVPVTFTYVWYTALVTIQYGAGAVMGNRMLSGFPDASLRLLSGHVTTGGVAVVLATLLITFLWTAGSLVQANMIGRYGQIAYAQASNSEQAV